MAALVFLFSALLETGSVVALEEPTLATCSNDLDLLPDLLDPSDILYPHSSNMLSNLLMFLSSLSLLEVDIGCLFAWIDHELNVARFPILIPCEHRFELYSVRNVGETEHDSTNLGLGVSMDIYNGAEGLQILQIVPLKSRRAFGSPGWHLLRCDSCQ